MLRSYDLRKKAGEIQIDRGTVDVGLRSQVTSGKHLDEVTELLAMDVVDMGIGEGFVHRRMGYRDTWLVQILQEMGHPGI